MVYILFLKEKYQIPAGHLELLWQNSVLPGSDRPAYIATRREMYPGGVLYFRCFSARASCGRTQPKELR